MTGKHLEEAQRLAMEVADPLPAIMSLVAANEDVNLPAIESARKPAIHRSSLPTLACRETTLFQLRSS